MIQPNLAAEPAAGHDLRSLLQESVRRRPARYLEIRFETATSSSLMIRKGFLLNCSPSRFCGGIVRALDGGGWGVATFNDPRHIDKAIGDAIACARLVGGRPVELAPIAPIQADFTKEIADDVRGATLAEKYALLESYDAIARSHDPRIAETSSYYREHMRDVVTVTSEGTSMRTGETILDLSIAAIARDGNEVQISRKGDAFRNAGMNVLRDREQWAEIAAREAIANLEAPQVQGGVYTVITDPQLTGLFTHEAFGHLSEADHQFQNQQVADSMRIGRVFGRPILNIYDSGVESDSLLGSVPVDDEGVPTRRTDLIRGGLLVGRLHSRETAARMNEEPTGSCRAQSGGHAPIVRMRNTAIAGGETPVADLFKGIDRGIYAVGGAGGQTRLGNYSFNARHGFLIENGEIARRVRDITLSGNIFETLANIDAIGDDPGWSCAGRCGKQGQSMTVGLGGPHVRIQKVVIGGA